MKISETGKLGEEKVCGYLTGQGYRIIQRNFRIKGGEIDIIAENGFYIAFVEVKTRRPDSAVTGFEAVTKRKKGLIIRAAAEYCIRHPNEFQPRFDIAQVIADNGVILRIDYIENAFDTTGYNFIF
ncbi:MAG: YraN family protein [Ruminococcus sp.]|nr:YraN family protein [Ruminococcus sp.]MBQ9078748.1 YraN family protein [Ruminococcus sp.]MBR6624346.1 YraN family protein [Ruminococcus sp.]